MFELVFTVCSVVSGATCRDLNPVTLEESVGIYGCAIASQVEAAKWAGEHPNFYISRSTCQPAKMFSKL